ncbi:DNA-3-methyladenine glycosylase [Candidatus Dojkabacteria bacterium]|nr:DNA-3-methyladenine glycosylase [Candidatus Dojkabacteria bacterium]
MKLTRDFYQNPALQIAPLFLGKKLIHSTNQGPVEGIISDVEAYPAKIDQVSHGNKRTRRTEIMYGIGGFAYIYLIYGIHYQFAAVVNKKNIPEVVFIRAVIPTKGIKLMKNNYEKDIKNKLDLTKSPGNLCKSFSITSDLYGEDLTKDKLFIEDVGININEKFINTSERVGISKRLKGHTNKFRFYISPSSIKFLSF